MSSLRIRPSLFRFRFWPVLFYMCFASCSSEPSTNVFLVWKNKIKQQSAAAVRSRLYVRNWGEKTKSVYVTEAFCSQLLCTSVVSFHHSFICVRSFVTRLLFLFFLFRVTLLFKNKKWSSFPFHFSGVPVDTWLTHYLNPHMMMRWRDFIC